MFDFAPDLCTDGVALLALHLCLHALNRTTADMDVNEAVNTVKAGMVYRVGCPSPSDCYFITNKVSFLVCCGYAFSAFLCTIRKLTCYGSIDGDVACKLG